MYTIYSLYTLFVFLVSDYKMYHAILGLLCVWLTYIAFRLGLNFNKNVYPDFNCELNKEHISFPLSDINRWSPVKYFFVALIDWLFAVLSAKFYTGRGFFSVLKGAFGGDSAYYTYQEYFLSNQLKSFSIEKIPYILMNAFITIILIWSVISLLSIKRKKWYNIVFVFLVVLAYLYFGASRGTNFEVYIVFILCIFCLIKKMQECSPHKKIVYIGSAAVSAFLMVFIYQARISDRGLSLAYSICPEIHFASNSFLGEYFPVMTKTFLSFFSYLGYGIYCIGVSVGDICMSSIRGLVSMSVPGGFFLISEESMHEMIKKTINVQARWIPDMVDFVDTFGFVLYFCCMFFLGCFLKNVMCGSYSVFLKNLIQVVITIEMLSLPVGNFLVTSSSNKIMVLFLLLFFIKSRYRISLY